MNRIHIYKYILFFYVNINLVIIIYTNYTVTIFLAYTTKNSTVH